MKRNAIEWIVLATSIGAIVLLVGALIIEGLSESRPASPRIEVRAAEARQTDLGWIVPATLVNEGDQAMESVIVEATATVDGEEEVSELDVAFLPAGTEVELAFAFSAQPEGEVTVRLVGHLTP